MEFREPPYQPAPRAEPSDARRIAVATACGLVAFPIAACVFLVSLWGPPILAALLIVPLALAITAARNAWKIHDRRVLRAFLLVLPILTALVVVPWVSFLAFTCIRGTNSCW